MRGKPLEDRGKCISTDAAVKHWIDRNGIRSQPKLTKFNDTNKEDSSTVELSLWEGDDRGTAVALYKITGGHGVLGRPQMMERFDGKYNQDIDGFEKTWEFFKQHGRGAEKVSLKTK